MPKSSTGTILEHFTLFSTMFNRIFAAPAFSLMVSLTTGLSMAAPAWAYKVEKICEDIPATAKEPALKKCKVVRATEGGSGGAKAGDAKAGGKDAKKDAKPAAH
jgi:hypothetical protein